MRRRRVLVHERTPTTVLGSPWFLGALGLLLVNDHVLKRSFPGPVTGKVSDLAGPVVVAVLGAVVVGRTAAVIATTLGFLALKTVPGVAEAAEPVLGGITRRDPTDLVGLVLLPLVWWALGRTSGAPPGAEPAVEPATVRGRRRRHVGAGPASVATWLRRRVVPVGGAALALVALTATSSSEPDEIRSLAASGTLVYAEIGPADADPAEPTLAVSDDGGHTWEEPENALPVEFPEPADEACRSDGHCFAARGATIESKAPGGEWTTAYEFTADEQEMLDYRRHGSDPPLDDLFTSVVVAPSPDGETVVVGARNEGVAVLDPDGSWERVGVLHVDPTPANGAMWPLDLMAVVLFASLPVGLLLVTVRSAAGGGGVWKVLGSIVGALLVGLATWILGMGVWAVGTYTAQNPVVLAMVLGALAVAVVLLPLAFVRRVDAEIASEHANDPLPDPG